MKPTIKSLKLPIFCAIMLTISCSDYNFFNTEQEPNLSPKENPSTSEKQHYHSDKHTPNTSSKPKPTYKNTNSHQMIEQEKLNSAIDYDKTLSNDITKDKAVKNDGNIKQLNEITKASAESFDEGNTTIAKPNRFIKSMALLGDSIGVGMLSDSQLGYFSFSDQIVTNFISDILQGDIDQDAYDKHYRTKGYNPFTSQGMNSLAVKLGLSESNTQNLAVSGSRIYQISGQISHMNKADLIVLEVGSNDICSYDHEINVFLSEYERVLKTLKSQEHKPTILVIPAFPIHKLSDYKKRPLFNSLIGFNSLTCQDSHAIMCGALLDFSQEQIFARLEGINKGIESVIHKLDPSTDQIILAPKLDSIPMQPEYLAIDCFHPNQNFNEYYAEMIWESLKKQIDHDP